MLERVLCKLEAAKWYMRELFSSVFLKDILMETHASNVGGPIYNI